VTNPSQPGWNQLSAVICASTVLGAAITVGICYVLFVSTVIRRIRRRPEVMFIGILLGLLEDLESSGSRLGDISFKGNICNRLEIVAVILSKAIPDAIDRADPDVGNLEVSKSFAARFRGGAAELRDMQARLVLMDETGIDDLKRDIVRYIEIVTQGKYGLLPPCSPEIPSESRQSMIVRIVKSVLIALLPAACLVGARYIGLKLSGSLDDWVIVAVLIWAAITLISAFDASYKTKLNDIRNIMSIVRGRSN
jgi:hypothetical protein